MNHTTWFNTYHSASSDDKFVRFRAIHPTAYRSPSIALNRHKTTQFSLGLNLPHRRCPSERLSSALPHKSKSGSRDRVRRHRRSVLRRDRSRGYDSENADANVGPPSLLSSIYRLPSIFAPPPFHPHPPFPIRNPLLHSTLSPTYPSARPNLALPHPPATSITPSSCLALPFEPLHDRR